MQAMQAMLETRRLDNVYEEVWRGSDIKCHSLNGLGWLGGSDKIAALGKPCESAVPQPSSTPDNIHERFHDGF
jgi:hypothetical protein